MKPPLRAPLLSGAAQPSSRTGSMSVAGSGSNSTCSDNQMEKGKKIRVLKHN
jgi:hypothetical protein